MQQFQILWQVQIPVSSSKDECQHLPSTQPTVKGCQAGNSQPTTTQGLLGTECAITPSPIQMKQEHSVCLVPILSNCCELAA